MEWIIGISTGLITAVILWFVGLLYRRLHNPIRWTITFRGGATWRFTRVAKRRALDVRVRSYGVALEVDDPYAGRDAGQNQHFDLVLPYFGEYILHWIEKDVRRNAIFETLQGTTNDIELRLDRYDDDQVRTGLYMTGYRMSRRFKRRGQARRP